MEAKYHIVTDLACRVLHFGTEVCSASPGKDISINLSRGKHILSFISTENSADCYKMVLDVPENDYESFIEVHLQPVVNLRLEREEKIRKEEAELKRKKDKEEENRRIKEAREKIEQEKKQQEHLFYARKFERLADYFSALYNDRDLYEVIPPRCSYDNKYGWPSVTKDAPNNKDIWAIPPKYDLATPLYYGIAMVGRIVELNPGYFDWKYYYIDVNGNTVYELSSSEQGIAYLFGVSIIVETDRNKPQYIRIVSKDGIILYKELLSETLTLAKRPEFPIHISTNYLFEDYVDLTFQLKDKNLDKALNHFWRAPSRISSLQFSYEERHSSPAYIKTYFDSLTSIHTGIHQ